MFTKTNAKALGARGGRAQRDLLTQHLISELNTVDPAQNVTKARLLVKSLIDNAIGGDVASQREVFDRVEGKAVQVNENYNHNEVSELSDGDLRRLLSERLLNGSAGAGVPEKTNGSGKPH